MRILIVHGGADTSCAEEYREGLRKAAKAGFKAMERGVLDAVEQAVICLEDDPHFNAGYGSELNRDGVVEMDAAIVDGASGRCGAVAAIQRVKNPVCVARRVMEETPHVLLAGNGATTFARHQGFPDFDPIYPARFEDWQKGIKGEVITGKENADTVGCIAVADGVTAAASSTGGLFMKLPGRVGDTGVFGTGILANTHGAVLCTGQGEAFIRVLAATRCLQMVAGGMDVEAAARVIMAEVSRIGGTGGILVVSSTGRVAAVYNAKSLPVCLIVDGETKEDFTPIKV